MDDIHVSIKEKPFMVKVVFDKKFETEIEMLREASKALMREVMRREADINRRFHR